MFFAYDEGWNIYWCSAVASRHSQNIYNNNGRVAIAVFDLSVAAGTGKGVYFSGTASEIGVLQAEADVDIGDVMLAIASRCPLGAIALGAALRAIARRDHI